MRQIIRHAIRLGIAVPAAAVVLAGCASEPSTTYWNGTPNAKPYTTSTTYGTSSTTVVNYPTGTYKLYTLTGGQPYWVWVPSGVTVEAPPPPPAVPVQTAMVVQPSTSTVVQPGTSTVIVQPAAPAQTVVAGSGQYTLYGDGRSTPYYWVWVPSGVTPPPPPPLPR